MAGHGHKVWTKEKFIIKAKEKYGDKFDYSLVSDFTNYKCDKVRIKCNDCENIYEITPNMHLISGGGGCKICSKKEKWTTEKFIKIANQIHNNKYDYSLVNIEEARKNKNQYVTIICPIHGKFKQKWKLHLSGCGCKQCFLESQFSTLDEFILKARLIHGDKYDYSKTKYNGRHYDVNIICPKHGEFITNAGRHLLGCGCNKCAHNFNLYKFEKLSLLTKYDLEKMDWAVIMDLIGEDKLPKEFCCLCKFGPNTEGRKQQIEKLKEFYGVESDELEDTANEIIEQTVSNIDNETYSDDSDENELKTYEEIDTLADILKVEEKEIYSTGDKYIHIFEKEISKLWGLVLRDNECHSKKNLEFISKKLNDKSITPFAKHIYEEFMKEYEKVISFEAA